MIVTRSPCPGLPLVPNEFKESGDELGQRTVNRRMVRNFSGAVLRGSPR
jgi:hypothetical protein